METALAFFMLRTLLRSGFAASRASAPLLLLLAGGCAGRTATTDPAPSAAAPALPPIPRADGPLAIRVQYPSPNALIAARDSTFCSGRCSTAARR